MGNNESSPAKNRSKAIDPADSQHYPRHSVIKSTAPSSYDANKITPIYRRHPFLTPSTSQQKNEQFFLSCPTLESHSPLRKRVRMIEDSFSLPTTFPSSASPDPHLSPIAENCNGPTAMSAGSKTIKFSDDSRCCPSSSSGHARFGHTEFPKSVTFDDRLINGGSKRKKDRPSIIYNNVHTRERLYPSSLESDDSSDSKGSPSIFRGRAQDQSKSHSDQEQQYFVNDTTTFINASSTTNTVSPEHNINNKPITSAVIRKGLKAKFKSISAWLLHEPQQHQHQHPLQQHFSGQTLTTINNSTSCPTGFSLKRWSSLRQNIGYHHHTYSPPSSHTKISKSGGEGLQQRSFQKDQLLSASRRSWMSTEQDNWTGSVNSLSDGRTPWPTLWLEAIFLPEFPNKGPVTDKHFTILGTIAKGTFGKVYRVCLKTQLESIFAMKVQSKSDVITQNAVQQIKDEVAIHQLLGEFGFIAQVFCTWQNRSKLYMVLQYVPGNGDLYQLWRDEGPFCESVVSIWIAELATAVDYIHGNGVIYRDIKMENILLDDNGHVQLIDFGLSKWLRYGEFTHTICGTLQYMAPEVLRGDDYCHAADWWSLGALAHTLLEGSYPFGTSTSHTTMQIDHYEAPVKFSVAARCFLEKLLHQDPKWRLRSFSLLKSEPFFSRITFDEIQLKKVHPFDFIPRMRRCNTCNIRDEDMQSLEECSLSMFGEEYDVFQQFDYFSEDVPGVKK